MKDIKDIVAVVTGGASGMGEATARALAAKGAKIAIWDMNKDAAQKVASDISGKAFECDITIEDSITECLQKTYEAFGGAPRIVVNCAGILIPSRICGREGPADLAHFEKVIKVNLIGSFNVLRLTAHEMTKLAPADPSESNERGVFINTASIAAYEGQIGQAAYSASKGGIVSMTLPAARELGKFGVRVMTIAPGAVETPMMAGVKDEYREAIESGIPFPSRMAKPEEFASLALHIVENEYLNGETIRLDGAARLAAK
jgi:NAD(P)-dependent dehydrogenase (short-subunit alcohol dehydrogenase family)